MAEGCGHVGAESIDVAEFEVTSPVPGEDLGCGDVKGADFGEGESAEPTLAGEDRGAGGGDRGEPMDPQRAAVLDERRDHAVADVVLHRDAERSGVATETLGDRLINLLERVKEEAADMV